MHISRCLTDLSRETRVVCNAEAVLAAEGCPEQTTPAPVTSQYHVHFSGRSNATGSRPYATAMRSEEKSASSWACLPSSHNLPCPMRLPATC